MVKKVSDFNEIRIHDCDTGVQCSNQLSYEADWSGIDDGPSKIVLLPTGLAS